MSLWPFARRTRAEVVRVLLDINGTSIGGACVVYEKGKQPVYCYGKRAPITAHAGEAGEAAMARALVLVCDALSIEGMAALTHERGVSRFDEALVAIDAPWQQTTVRVEEKRAAAPFTFTRRALADMLLSAENAVTKTPDCIVDQERVGIRLNGYPTTNPFGQKVRRAAVVILLSSIQRDIAEAVVATVRATLRLRAPSLISGVALRYRVLAAAFPHERDMLLLDAAGHGATLSLVRAHTLVAVEELSAETQDARWAMAVAGALRKISSSYPLPRTLLLIAGGEEATRYAEVLGASNLAALWITDEPPHIVPVSRLPGEAPHYLPETRPDIYLSLMARYLTLPSHT